MGIFAGGLVLALSGCGQKGPLYLPANDPNAAQRATLPQALLNIVRTPRVPQPPASAASAPDAAASKPQDAAPPLPPPALP
ncbi:MAG: lipoprotein, partial [Burkholderiaceae bacterium]|nr:lipoprotein [Burkholderiaceae bacterium]